MSEDTERFRSAIAAIDAVNAQDPERESVAGEMLPGELVYGRRMSERLARLRPDAPEALRLAVRSQHIQRWSIPRRQYPMDRAGYKRWRTDLAKHHADVAAGLLRPLGYGDETVARVRALLRKLDLKRDDDAQTLEDVACLVFLQHYLEGFASRQDDDKLVVILRKTWVKMSPRGQAAARELKLPPRLRALLGRALEE